MKTLFALLIAAICCTAQTSIPDDQQTLFGQLNGRFWVATSVDRRIGFLVGYAEGWKLWRQSGKDKDTEGLTGDDWFPVEVPYADIITGLNQFYASPENLPIPIYRTLQLLA